jgi:hypothetical protein
VTGKRGGRAIRPAQQHEWTLRYHSREVAEGWENLCAQQSGIMATLYDKLTNDPRHVDNPERQGRLIDRLRVATINGELLEQWQYEVSGGGRVWYAINDATRVVWITKATARHPNETK